jgi:hypothetical protein
MPLSPLSVVGFLQNSSEVIMELFIPFGVVLPSLNCKSKKDY